MLAHTQHPLPTLPELDSFNHSGSSLHKSASQSRPDKESSLKKYQEDNKADDLEGFDSIQELSFSKFSNISGGSVIVKDEVHETHSKDFESPFVKKLQRDLNVEIDSDNTKPYYPTVYPIFEYQSNDENRDSPFIDYGRSKTCNSLKINNNKLRKQQETAKPGRPISKIQSTPKHQRTSSVKVSLTPAQRFEKRSNTRLCNALENFEFITLVGNGAFASVYKALNLTTNQVVAIKQIRIEKDQDVGTLMGEIDLLKILKHPNIVKYHGFVKTSVSLNVILEYCEGGSLRQLYKKLKKGLPETQIINYVSQILHGLTYLHEQGVVHRDVKAANVLLTDKGDVKLADFGVATKVNSQHFTVVGTPNWMAPETVLGGEGICTASDIWSLGATIIELFTTNPPYHDLNPMATLHAIGTDEHPPLPKSISSLARDFLLECFQKQPNLRISAKLLLKHKWLNHQATGKTSMSVILKQQSREFKSIKNYSEANDENWDTDFAEVRFSKLNNAKPSVIELQLESEPEEYKPTEYSKNELLTKFTEKDNETFHNTDMTTIQGLKLGEDATARELEESDPFLNIEIENFDTNELEVQSKMEYLAARLGRKLEAVHVAGEDVVPALVKVTGRMLHLIKKYPVLHDTLIRDHGILSLLELLENASEIKGQQQLWYHCLAILNYIFESNVGAMENFCFLGGIPTVADFRTSAYEIQVRLQVARFIGVLNLSDKALSMFVSCGGLSLVSKFVEEDFESTPAFPLVAIESVHNILVKDLSRSKSDLCRILAKHGIMFWLVDLLAQLVKSPHGKNLTPDQVDATVDKIVDVIKYFGQSETRVRVSIGTVDLFKLMFTSFDDLSFSRQLVVLKFVKSMSCISDLLKNLYHAEVLEFLVRLLETYTASKSNYKEVINVVAQIIYNMLALNHARASEFVRLGGLPYLKSLSIINLPFRQFILPIICEFVHCDNHVRRELKKYEMLTVYFNLLLDPYWQSNALDSIYFWYQLDSTYVQLESPVAVDCLIGGFLLTKVSNLESTLEIYMKLLTSSSVLSKKMLNMPIINNILMKLAIHDNKNPVIQLLYLKVLRCLIKDLEESENKLAFSKPIRNCLESLQLRKSSLLIEEVAIELVVLVE
ncbi:Cytokinesis protein sepH [Candida viswanathii]|uniref:non-specific serine/threonine protein kinase n=1 Tax=Candida viswanathii TaxID=5486 RepID=A0A367XQR7_9ASCO|nr:Cytokinesis protein sepH [Candida viswanathii]